MLDNVCKCLIQDRALYTRHARQEMLGEERGIITDAEVFLTIQAGKLIESYPDDEPYPSMLIPGKTEKGRSLHVVCA